MSGTEMMKHQETLEKTAAYWAMRLSSPECGPADRAAFEVWRSGHQRPARDTLAYYQFSRKLHCTKHHIKWDQTEKVRCLI